MFCVKKKFPIFQIVIGSCFFRQAHILVISDFQSTMHVGDLGPEECPWSINTGLPETVYYGQVINKRRNITFQLICEFSDGTELSSVSWVNLCKFIGVYLFNKFVNLFRGSVNLFGSIV